MKTKHHLPIVARTVAADRRAALRASNRQTAQRATNRLRRGKVMF